MALITCPECQAQISDKAAACPKCGAPAATVAAAAPPTPPAPTGGGNVGFTIIMFLGGVFVIFMLVGIFSGNSPPDAKQQARSAITLCWEQQARKSLDPGSARFVAGACERMEADFRQQYGVSP